jgi:hypothetical protein
MKPLTVLGLAACCAMLVAVSRTSGAEPAPSADSATKTSLQNADLEEGSGSPSGWRYGHADRSAGTWSWDTENAHSGKRAFRIHKENAEGFSVLASDFIAVEPGKTYEVTGWAKVHQPTEAGIYLMASQHTPDSEATQLPNAFTDPKAKHPVGEWQRLRLRFTAREGNVRVRVRALVAGAPCQVTWDDFSVSPLSR